MTRINGPPTRAPLSLSIGRCRDHTGSNCSGIIDIDNEWHRNFSPRFSYPRATDRSGISHVIVRQLLLSLLKGCDENLNYHPLEVVSRYRDPHLQVGENYSYLCNLRPNICKLRCLSTYFVSKIEPTLVHMYSISKVDKRKQRPFILSYARRHIGESHVLVFSHFKYFTNSSTWIWEGVADTPFHIQGDELGLSPVADPRGGSGLTPPPKKKRITLLIGVSLWFGDILSEKQCPICHRLHEKTFRNQKFLRGRASWPLYSIFLFSPYCTPPPPSHWKARSAPDRVVWKETNFVFLHPLYKIVPISLNIFFCSYYNTMVLWFLLRHRARLKIKLIYFHKWLPVVSTVK